MVPPAVGLADLVHRFGALQLAKDPRGSGFVIASPAGWESANMVLVPSLPGYPHRLYVNKAVVEPLTTALAETQKVCPAYVIKTMGCFCPRLKRVNGDLSVHSWGLAVDINADANPLADKLITDMPPEFVMCFKNAGFTWGGQFTGKRDPMHFQYCSKY